MDGTVITGVRTIPMALPFERAWRWCVLMSVRDLRTSAVRRRTMSLPNTRRLYLRRFHELCRALGMSDDSTLRVHHATWGTHFLWQTYQAQVERGSRWASQS